MTTTTTPAAPTTEQIQALRSEAGAAGDREMVRTCDRALAGDEAAIAECERVIADARAQDTAAAPETR